MPYPFSKISLHFGIYFAISSFMKTLYKNIIITISTNLLFTASLYAEKIKLPEYCLDSSIKSVQAQVDSASKKTFKYYYQKITKHTNPSKPTFIIIPGGPGRSAMTSAKAMFYDEHTAELTTSTELYWGLPVQSNLILTGPRSVDCNANNNLPASSYSTKNIVQDLVTLIKKEKLTNYIIVGRSYGSVVATQLSHYIENDNAILNPKAVLLTGVLGHYLDINTQATDLQNIWGQLYKELPSTVQVMFPPDISLITNSQDFKFPLGIGAQTWLNMISAELRIGFNYFTYTLALKDYLIDLKNTLDKLKRVNTVNTSPHYKKLQQHLKNLKRTITYYAPEIDESPLNPAPQENSTKKAPSLFEVITQKEIYIGIGKDPSNISQLWNSNKYQINKIPLIYFQGSWDIATPISNALSHYRGQSRNKHKYFFVANKGGHDILPGLNDCKTDFWQSMSINNFKAMITTVQDCDLNFKLLKNN